MIMLPRRIGQHFYHIFAFKGEVICAWTALSRLHCCIEWNEV